MDFEARELLRKRVLASPASTNSSEQGAGTRPWRPEDKGMESLSGPSADTLLNISHLPHLDYSLLGRGWPCFHIRGIYQCAKERGLSPPCLGQLLSGLTGSAQLQLKKQVQKVLGQSLPQEELEQGGGHFLATLSTCCLLDDGNQLPWALQKAAEMWGSNLPRNMTLPRVKTSEHHGEVVGDRAGISGHW